MTEDELIKGIANKQLFIALQEAVKTLNSFREDLNSFPASPVYTTEAYLNLARIRMKNCPQEEVVQEEPLIGKIT